jgi:hypothetical protein
MRNPLGLAIAISLAFALALGLGCKKKDEAAKQGDPAAAAGDKPASDKAAGDKAAGGKPAGACDRRAKERVCGEYHGAAKTDWVKQECAAMGAPFVETCPKEGAVGRCVGEAGTPMEVHSVFYGPGLTKEQFAMMCKAPMQPREP